MFLSVCIYLGDIIMCGVVGIFNVEEAQKRVRNILFAIQHRGQESCGIASHIENGGIFAYRNMGLVKHVLTDEILKQYVGNSAIGHVRYPTAGSNDVRNTQPHAIELAQGPQLAICSNGDIINYAEIRNWLETEHSFIFKSDNDGELIGRLIAFYLVVEHNSIEKSIELAMEKLKGAYSTMLMYKDIMFAFRDPHGFRPFVIGHVSHTQENEIPSDGTVLTSESSGFGIVGATMLRELNPGEILKMESGKIIKSIQTKQKEKQHCVFELIYFSRPDSSTFGEYVYDVRDKIGAVLARKDMDIPGGDDLVVMPVPDSSNFVAHGYAKERGVPFEMGLLRNHYVGRTFISPEQKMRDEGVKQKFNPLPGYFPGKRVVLVDDSIVRGTTLRKIVRMVRAAGAKEVHVRIGSPKVIGSCYYGIDTPTRSELIANKMSLPEIAEYLTADSIKYMEISDFDKVLKKSSNYCFACFDLDYI
jgi:amidophosphoribosyltransferase